MHHEFVPHHKGVIILCSLLYYYYFTTNDLACVCVNVHTKIYIIGVQRTTLQKVRTYKKSLIFVMCA